MKKSIIIDADGGGKWIGGLYYKKNVAFQLSQNRNIVQKYNIMILTDKENQALFEDLNSCVKVKSLPRVHGKIRILFFTVLCFVFRVRLIYPAFGKVLQRYNVNWIPDFQHDKLPQFFDDEECRSRTETFMKYAKSRRPLVLSSQDALSDFKTFYSSTKENVYVMPFVSYIESDIQKLTASVENDILNKYSLTKQKYACIMNQFWQHKNHIVIFKALELHFTNHPEDKTEFVFTGNMEDYRNPDYIHQIKELCADPAIKPHVKVLGFIDRCEQIAIMKNASYVIQPSLFEGWGTVVEDAKVLDKTILLSDIAVHREQMNKKCILFNPNDEKQLAELIWKENQTEHIDDVDAGIADMYKRAEEYSKGFEKLLDL